MGHDKLRKFAENETFACLIQPSASELLADGFEHLRDHALKGHWAEWFLADGRQSFASGKGPSGVPQKELQPALPSSNTPSHGGSLPIVLELGCGKGEYTLELARRNPDKFYIGVDIKGARLWRGAKTATQEGLKNVAFLRTRIEFIGAFFGPDEVSEIWLTFSDPQMKSENSRLTSPVFLERYRRFLKPGGIVHLKTDSRFLHLYTLAVATVNHFPILCCTENLYATPPFPTALGKGQPGVPQGEFQSALPDPKRLSHGGSSLPSSSLPAATGNLLAIPSEVREVQTYYESMFLKQGLPITYMAFTIDGTEPVAYPRDPEDFDSKSLRAAEKSRLD